MFEQLDAAIAFVVVMLMLSLLVTAIVQTISALLDLRGKNLVRALSDLFAQIDSGLRSDADESEKGIKYLFERAKNVWTHPFTKITLATRVADAVSMHPTIAHTFSRAKAIRKDELLNVLQDLGSDSPARDMDSTA